MRKDLVELISELKEKESLSEVQQRLDEGESALGILDDARRALEIVGQRFEKNVYFIPDLVYSGEIVKRISELVKAEIKQAPDFKTLGKYLIGTVSGDIHDLGKNIVAFLLKVNGFEVIDLGVNVPAQRFVDAIREHQLRIVGMSCLLTTAFDAMKKTIQAIAEAGLREQVKIMIGGAVLDEKVVGYVGADILGPSAASAVSISKDWLGIK